MVNYSMGPGDFTSWIQTKKKPVNTCGKRLAGAEFVLPHECELGGVVTVT